MLCDPGAANSDANTLTIKIDSQRVD